MHFMIVKQQKQSLAIILVLNLQLNEEQNKEFQVYPINNNHTYISNSIYFFVFLLKYSIKHSSG